MKKTIKYFIPVLGLIGISIHLGCRTLSTTPGYPASGPINGVLYYLPIGKITIKGEYTSSDSNAANSRRSQRNAASISMGSVQFTEAAAARIATAAPTATAAASATPTATASPTQLKITLTPEVEADESFGEFYVTPHANYLYEDEVQVTINGKRLLSAGKVTTQDKTAEIIGAVASLVSSVLKRQPGAVAAEQPQPFDFTFHPSRPSEVIGVRKQLCKRGIWLSVTMNGTDLAAQRVSTLSRRQVRSLATEFGKKGLLFRPAISYKIRLLYPVDPEQEKAPLCYPETKSIMIDNTQQFIFPDPTRLYAIEYERMAFVKKVKDIGFTDGMLTDYHQTVQSPILGFLGIPKAIVEAIVPVLGSGSSGSGSASGTTGSQ